jgi:hypothetical protein
MTKICIFARSEDEARRWARSQNLNPNQYFYPHSKTDLLFRTNFHVIAVGMTELSVNPSFFEEIYNLALERGKIGRI